MTIFKDKVLTARNFSNNNFNKRKRFPAAPNDKNACIVACEMLLRDLRNEFSRDQTV